LVAVAALGLPVGQIPVAVVAHLLVLAAAQAAPVSSS